MVSGEIRGNAEIRRCRSCGSDLVRPTGPGRHKVACPQCGETWLVELVGDRMILAGLTEDQVDRALGESNWGCLLLLLAALAVLVATCSAA